MLNVDTTPQYLIDRGLLSVDSILDGDLIVSSAMRRNRNVRVKRQRDVSYLLKQPDAPGAGGEITLRNEAAFYAWIHESPAAEPMRELVPRLRLFDPERSLVVLELIEDAQPLWGHYSAHDGQPFPTAGARAAGRAIGRLHRTLANATGELPWLSKLPPWIMRVHKPSPDLLASLTPANAETIRILQTQEQLSLHLDALRRQWQPSTVTHNDIKSDNILVLAREEGVVEARLVDWELVAAGDPAWDVAGMLQDFILFWISAMPLAGMGVPPATMVASARYKLTDLHPAIRAFWSGYANELGAAEAAALAVRAVAFSAARLIQSAYEIGAVGGSLNPVAVLLLQISANVLRDPARARMELYGLIPTGVTS